MAEELSAVFESADANGDGLISRAESLALFPDLTELQFDELDTNSDGFLSRAELGQDEPGGCFGPSAAADFFLFGLVAWLFSVFEAILRMPRQILEYLYGGAIREDED
ncbi:MAG: hypothetical protein ABL994_19820 [Verrucomicrobiales bacterium]